MLDGIERARKMLSANTETSINLDSLLEDIDLHKNIKRTEFEELIQPMIQKFGVVLQEAFEKSGLTKQ